MTDAADRVENGAFKDFMSNVHYIRILLCVLMLIIHPKLRAGRHWKENCARPTEAKSICERRSRFIMSKCGPWMN
jgi:hypothetical protein